MSNDYHNVRELAEIIAVRAIETDETQEIHTGSVYDLSLPVNEMFSNARWSEERAAMEFVTSSGKYGVLVYKVQD
jgi:hypothetical protein